MNIQIKSYKENGKFVEKMDCRDRVILADKLPECDRNYLKAHKIPKLELILFSIAALFIVVSYGNSEIVRSQENSVQSDSGKLHQRAVELAREGKYQESLTIFDEAIKNSPGDADLILDYIVTLGWSDKSTEAIEKYERLPEDLPVPEFVTRPVAKAYRNEQKYEKAAELYMDLIRKNPDDLDAFHGLVLVLIDLDRIQASLDVVEEGLQRHPESTQLLLEKAFILRRKGSFLESIQVCDKVLAKNPFHPRAIHARIAALSDMGAVSLAMEYAVQNMAQLEPEIRLYLLNNMAAKRILWGEFQRAISLLTRMIEQEKVPMELLRSRYDLILALARMERMSEVLEVYRQVKEAGITPPYWITDAVASAHLYLRQSNEAVKMYRLAIEQAPGRFESRMGLYYALVEAGKFREARRVREKLEEETPEWVSIRGIERYNWDRQEVAMEKGWWLVYQDRLAEAQKYFENLRRVAPANSAARTALAQIHVWRGWPREGLEDFEIVISMAEEDRSDDPEDGETNELPAKNGRITALNQSYRKVEAREYAEQIQQRNPNNVDTRNIHRALELEDRAKFLLDVVFTDEQPNLDDFYLLARLDQPITPDFNVYAFALRRETDSAIDAAVTNFSYDRIGVGADWNLLRPLTMSLEYSVDVDTGKDAGYAGRLEWRASDTVSFDAGHNTFSLDVPVRARAVGIEGEMTDAGVTYRSSDVFSIRAGAVLHELDDQNENLSYSVNAEREILTRAYVRSRLFLEYNRSDNRLTDVAYFSPDYSTTYALTHMLQHVIYRRYEHAFVHRLFLGVGQYDQALFDREFIWNARYEHDYLFSDKTALLWGVNFQRRYYDAEETDVASWYLTFRKTL